MNQHYCNVKAMNSIASDISSTKNIGDAINYPEKIVLTYTYACNFKCFMCNLHNSPAQHLPESIIKKFEHVLPFARVFAVSGGEPLIRDSWIPWFQEAKRHCVSTEIGTNGSLMRGETADKVAELCDSLHVSIDAGTSKTYQAIRGHSFTDLLRNVHDVLNKAEKIRRHIDVVFRFVAMRRNVAELAKLVGIAHSFGVKTVVSVYMRSTTAQTYSESLFLDKDYSDMNMMKARAVADEFGVNLMLPHLFQSKSVYNDASSKHAFCREPWKYLEVNPLGVSGLCCSFAGSGDNIIESSFEDVWNSPIKRAVRSTVNTDHEMPCCKNCKFGLIMDPNNPASHFGGEALEVYKKHKQDCQYIIV